MTYENHLELYAIPDIDIPPSPPQQSISSANKQTTMTIERNVLNILTRPLSLSRTSLTIGSHSKKTATKRKKKKKPMSQYRPPSPFSPKPDYKSMEIEEIKRYAARYGLSTTQAKGRLVKILDEIYNVTHQYETDTDYEFDTNDVVCSKYNSNRKGSSGMSPTLSTSSHMNKLKKRPAVHQMSSSDESEEHPLLSEEKIISMTASNNNQYNESDKNDTDYKGRFLELTVYDLSSSTTSTSSLSITNMPTPLVENSVHPDDSQSKLFFRIS